MSTNPTKAAGDGSNNDEKKSKEEEDGHMDESNVDAVRVRVTVTASSSSRGSSNQRQSSSGGIVDDVNAPMTMNNIGLPSRRPPYSSNFNNRPPNGISTSYLGSNLWSCGSSGNQCR